MTAAEIIREIDALPLGERLKVVQHARDFDFAQPLSGGELNEIEERMMNATTPEEGDYWQKKLVDGFFGTP